MTECIDNKRENLFPIFNFMLFSSILKQVNKQIHEDFQPTWVDNLIAFMQSYRAVLEFEICFKSLSQNLKRNN